MPTKKLILPLFALLIFSFACAFLTGKSDDEEYNFKPYGPLAIAPDALPEAKIGEAYQVEIRISQNVTPVGDMSIDLNALPEGLEFNFIQGEDRATISGVPQEAGEFNIIVNAWCYGTNVSGQTIEKDYRIIVNP